MNGGIRQPPGSTVYAYTDSGRTNGTEYYYTVKAVSGCGESQPSDEDSDIPDSGAIPWDGADAGQITSAARTVAGIGPVNLVRVVGPDHRVYDSIEGTLSPDGEFIDDVTYSLRNGSTTTLLTDGAEEEEGAGAISATPVNATA